MKLFSISALVILNLLTGEALSDNTHAPSFAHDLYEDWNPDLSITDFDPSMYHHESDMPSIHPSHESDFTGEYFFPFSHEPLADESSLFPLESPGKRFTTQADGENNLPSDLIDPSTLSQDNYSNQQGLPDGNVNPAFNSNQTTPSGSLQTPTGALPTPAGSLQTPGTLQTPLQTALPSPQTPANASTPTSFPTAPNPSPLTSGAADGTTTGLDNEFKPILINFNNVSMIEFIRFISRISNKNFIFNDADLEFNVTIVSEEPATVENIMAILMQVLRVHGLSLLEQGNNILIHGNKGVSGVAEVVAEGLPYTKRQRESELVTRVFRLNTLDAEKAAVIIQPLISEGALVEALKETNQIIVTDITTNVEKIGQLLKSLDSPNSGLILGQYVAVNALLDSLINLAERVMEPIAEGKPLVFVAHSPSNSVFVVSSPFLVDRSLAVLRNLDINVGVTRIFSGDSLRFGGLSQEAQPLQGGAGSAYGYGPGGIPLGENGLPLSVGGLSSRGLASGVLESRSPWSADLPAGHIERTKFYIHKLRYRRGEQIVDALGRVGVSLQESGSGNLDLVSTIQSIQWLEASNSLVFTGTIDAVAKVKELIEEIDTPLRQVFIEMLIISTSLDDSLTYSVNFGSRFDTHNSTFGSQAFISEANTLAAALDTATASNPIVDITGFARQQGFNLGIVGRNISHGGLSFDTVAALVSAFHDKDKVEILMNPKLLVEDNQTAEIFVGINTPFQISSITNDFGQIITNNFEFRDVGTLLRVTPLISNNDVVTLEIREEVSSVTTTPVSTSSLSNISPGPTTNISRTVTKVHVPNKYFLVMSGMIQDTYERRRKQVPCLGGAPIIGALFSDKAVRDQKRNLMIFIRPQIIDTVDDIDFITRHEQDIYRNKNRSKKMWKYEVEEALDLLNIKCPDVSLHDDEEFNP